MSGQWYESATGPAGAARADQTARVTGSGAAALVALEVDLLLAHFTADALLIGHGLLGETHAFDRDGLGVHHGPFGVQDDLVLGFAQVGSGRGVVAVGAGDRLTLEAYLFPAYREEGVRRR